MALESVGRSGRLLGLTSDGKINKGCADRFHYDHIEEKYNPSIKKTAPALVAGAAWVESLTTQFAEASNVTATVCCAPPRRMVS